MLYFRGVKFHSVSKTLAAFGLIFLLGEFDYVHTFLSSALRHAVLCINLKRIL